MENRRRNQKTDGQGHEESSITDRVAAHSARGLAYSLAFRNRGLLENASRTTRCVGYRNCNYCPDAGNIATGLQTHAIEAKRIVDRYYEDNAGGLQYPGSPVDPNDREFYDPPSDSNSSSSWSVVSSSGSPREEQESNKTRGESKTDHDGPEFD